MKSVKIGQVVSEKKIIKDYMILNMYEGVSKNTWTFIITLKLLNVNR